LDLALLGLVAASDLSSQSASKRTLPKTSEGETHIPDLQHVVAATARIKESVLISQILIAGKVTKEWARCRDPVMWRSLGIPDKLLLGR
jgi:hypothetical protein